MKIPFIDLKIQNGLLKSEILALWEEILESADFIGGKHVEGFEDDFAEACEAQFCVSVNSGTDALRFILLSLELNAGDEVITVPNTFIATTEAITQAGGKIVFVDIDPETYNMDPSKLEAAINKHTKGIVPVHLFGQPADMDPILSIADKHGLWVVEDACQAHLSEYKGRRTGSLGIAGAFSFYPGKNLGGCGEGGAVVTNNKLIADKVKKLRDHGQAIKYFHDIEGYNGRCDALQAAALRIKLKYLPEWNKKRQTNANHYYSFLKDTAGIVLPYIDKNCRSVFHLFVIQVDNRVHVQEKLKENGVVTALHYPLPLHLQKAYGYMKLKPGSFPIAEHAADCILSLPMYPELTEVQIRYACEQLINILKKE